MDYDEGITDVVYWDIRYTSPDFRCIYVDYVGCETELVSLLGSSHTEVSGFSVYARPFHLCRLGWLTLSNDTAICCPRGELQ